MTISYQCFALSLSNTRAVVECQSYAQDWTPGSSFGTWNKLNNPKQETWQAVNGLVVRTFGGETWMFLEGRWVLQGGGAK